MNTMLHIVPQLPPAMDGVADFCANLRRHWPDPEWRWQFAVLHGLKATQAIWPEVPVHSFSPSVGGLTDILSRSGADVVVLHYVGYGYQPKGIPIWLPTALAQWRSVTGGRLMTMFHELYADGAPWQSAFWVKPWARRIIARLVAASDTWLTSCQRYHDRLVKEFGAEPERGSRVLIGSNVPRAAEIDLERLWPFEFGRKLRVVLFGFPNTRRAALQRHANLLGALVQADMVESGTDPGARFRFR